MPLEPGKPSSPLARRTFLQVGGMALGGLAMPRISCLEAAVDPRVRQKSVIMVYLPGGASHIDMYDMKPNAPVEYRGEFDPVDTNVAGIQVCELMPEHAKIADKFSLIRSASHGFGDHDGAHKRMLTGRIPKSAVGFMNDAPSVGSIVNKVRGQVRTDMLAFTSEH